MEILVAEGAQEVVEIHDAMNKGINQRDVDTRQF